MPPARASSAARNGPTQSLDTARHSGPSATGWIGDVRDRAEARAVGADDVEHRERRLVRQASPVDRQTVGQRPATGAQRGGRRAGCCGVRRGDAPLDEQLAVAVGRDPAEQVAAFDRARSGVRVDARREHRARSRPSAAATASRTGVAKPRRHARAGRTRAGTRAELAAHEHGAHLEIVVHLGRRLVLDEARELHRRRRRDDRAAEAGLAAHRHRVIDRHRAALVGRAVRGLDDGDRGPSVGRGDRRRTLATHRGQQLLERRAGRLGQLDALAVAVERR